MSNVTFAEGSRLTTIGDGAFIANPPLETINLPDGLREIGRGVFSRGWECLGLSTISFPNSLEIVLENSFRGTPWFANQPDGKVYTGSVLYAFKGAFPADGRIEIARGTLGIAESALAGTWHYIPTGTINAVLIPSSVREIGEFGVGFRLGDFWPPVPIPGFTIYGVRGTAAERFANEHGFNFVEVEEFVLGDITGTGVVNIMDLQALLRHVSRRNLLIEERQLLAADVNRDKVVDILDLRLLLQYVSRRINSFD